MTNIWCTKCDEAVTHDGKTWIACHCYGCNESEESQYPEQWVVSKELPTRAELLAKITALETAGRPIAQAVKVNAPSDDETLDEEQFLYDVFQNLTAGELLNFTALLGETK